jgi:hypothetical protein
MPLLPLPAFMACSRVKFTLLLFYSGGRNKENKWLKKGGRKKEYKKQRKKEEGRKKQNKQTNKQTKGGIKLPGRTVSQVSTVT